MSSDLPADGDDTALDVVVPPLLDGVRVDRALSMLTGCTRSVSGAARRRRRGARRRRGGRASPPSCSPRASGSQATLGADDGGRARARARRRGRVVLEDPSFLVVDKPAGLVVHPGAGHPTGTLVAGPARALPRARGARRARRAPPRTAPASSSGSTRGPRGVLVVARTPAAYASLTAQLAARTVERRYVGLVEGDVADEPRRHRRADRALPAHPDEDGRARRRPRPRAPPTRCGRASPTPARTLLELRLESGRTHQIRVHLAAIGRPIVNDPRYGQHREPRARRGPRLPARRGRSASRTPRPARSVRVTSTLPARPRRRCSHERSAAERRSVRRCRSSRTTRRRWRRSRVARDAGRPRASTPATARCASVAPSSARDLVVAPPDHRREHAAEPDVVRGEEDRPGERVDRGAADEACSPSSSRSIAATSRRSASEDEEHGRLVEVLGEPGGPRARAAAATVGASHERGGLGGRGR